MKIGLDLVWLGLICQDLFIKDCPDTIVPASYRIDVKLGIVFSKIWGSVTDSELLLRQHNMSNDPDFHAEFAHFYDLSEAKLTEVTTPVIHQLAADSPFGEGSKRAILAPQDLAYGLSRIYETAKSSDEGLVRVFRTREEANRWLGLEDENGHYRLA